MKIIFAVLLLVFLFGCKESRDSGASGNVEEELVPCSEGDFLRISAGFGLIAVADGSRHTKYPITIENPRFFCNKRFLESN